MLERAQIPAEDNVIALYDLPDNIHVTAPMSLSSVTSHAEASKNDPLNLQDVELRTVQAALAQAKGNKVHAAKALGVSRRALYRMIEKYRIRRQHKPLP